MARRKAKADLGTQAEPTSSLPVQMDKIIRLLALLVVKGESQQEKIKALSGASFSNVEIAKLLCITPNNVNVTLHHLRKSK